MIKFATKFHLIFLIFIFLFSVQVAGQTLVSGQVQEVTGKPFPFANVLLLNTTDSSLVKGMLSGETGVYSFENVKPGSYLISSSAVGYKQIYSKTFAVNPDKSTLQINTLMLKESSKELGEVAVVAAKPLFEQHLDRMVVNVQNSITAAGSTALEVLERSPGISLNRQNNSISMAGKEGVVVMINGKNNRLPLEAVLQMLSGMNANNIEKIELITTPSAQFDAEGNAGVINIITKKNENFGTNGSYALTMGYGWYERPGANANLTHRTNKLNLFADGSFLWSHHWFSGYTSRSFLHNNQNVRSSNHSDRNTFHMIYNGRFGLEYNLGANTTLNGLIAGFNNREEQFALNKTAIHYANELNTTINIKDHENNQWRHIMSNLNLQHLFKDKSKISLDLDYLLYHHRNPHLYKNHYQYSEDNTELRDVLKSTKYTPIHIGVGKIDYSRKIDEKTDVETGLKGTLSWLKNDVLLERFSEENWQKDAEFSQNLRMNEEIGAAYVNMQRQITTSTKLQAGLRWEYTNTELFALTGENLVKRQYQYLFPSLFMSHELNKNNDVQFSYSRRITRPTYRDLAPVFTFMDPYTALMGNSTLRPAITDAVQVVYQWKKSYLLTMKYSYDKDAISYVMRVDPEQNKQYIHPNNINNVNTYSLNLTIPFNPTSWWQMQNNLTGNWQDNSTMYQDKYLRVKGYSGKLNSNQTFLLPKNFSFEVSGFYNTRSFMGILQIRPYGSVNLGLQKKLPNEAGTLRFTVTDLFWNMRFEAESKLPQMNLFQDIGFRYEPRVLRLTYSRNFGNKKVKALNSRATGSEEERSRAGN